MLKRRIEYAEQAVMRLQFQLMNDRELLRLLSDESKIQWHQAGVSEQEMLRRVKAVLRAWNYL